MKTLKNKLTEILASKHEAEPNFKMWVDDNSIYAVFEEDNETHFLYMTDHGGIDDYVDENHLIEDINYATEGVGSQGVFWMNQDFESPFHVSEFEDQIKTVTI